MAPGSLNDCICQESSLRGSQKMFHHRVKSGAQTLLLGILFTCVTMVLYCFSTPSSLANTQRYVMAAPCVDQAHTLPKQDVSQSSQRTCTRRVNLMFLKTHKAASSTVLNILLRFGQKNQLRFALPDSRNDFFYPSSFVRSQVKDYRPGECFNIVCNHMRFNAHEVKALLPPDAFFFTILRDPALVFESSFHYYNRVVPLTWMIREKDKLTGFLKDPDRYFSSDGLNSFYLKNLQLFDLGFENTLEPDDPAVEEAIAAVSDRFQLVMISEHFDESLILLKDALCWQMDDLLFFKLNERRGVSVSKLSSEISAKARQWNGADWKLYRHFNATFWAKVDAYGWERMERDVKELRRRNQEMRTICIEGGAAVEEGDIRDQSMRPWQPVGESSILGYNLRTNIDQHYNELCRKMLTPEIQYLSELGVNLWVTRLWGWLKDNLL